MQKINKGEKEKEGVINTDPGKAIYRDHTSHLGDEGEIRDLLAELRDWRRETSNRYPVIDEIAIGAKIMKGIKRIAEEAKVKPNQVVVRVCCLMCSGSWNSTTPIEIMIEGKSYDLRDYLSFAEPGRGVTERAADDVTPSRVCSYFLLEAFQCRQLVYFNNTPVRKKGGSIPEELREYTLVEGHKFMLKLNADQLKSIGVTTAEKVVAAGIMYKLITAYQTKGGDRNRFVEDALREVNAVLRKMSLAGHRVADIIELSNQQGHIEPVSTSPTIEGYELKNFKDVLRSL